MPSLLSRLPGLRRHIQDHTLDVNTEHHWGYAERQVPCLNDPGSCAYLDVVYGSYDTGMIYTGVMWLTLLLVFSTWGIMHFFSSSSSSSSPRRAGGRSSTSSRLWKAAAAGFRRRLLPDSAPRSVFGRTTRLQVLVLAALVAYLTAFSFAGLKYGEWVTPVKKDHPGAYNTRTTLGPWSNRVGVLAYALTPLSVLLASRESLLSVVTGVPYQGFNFLHRWLGYVMVVQAALHTVGWCVVMTALYQPQPETGRQWIRQAYMVWGVVAFVLVLALCALSLPCVVRLTGYEFFRKSHYVLAMLYCGACIAHWEKLHCFLTPAVALWFVDRALRLARTCLIHRRGVDVGDGGWFHSARAKSMIFRDGVEGDVVRLDFRHPGKAWHLGQHFYLCFPEGSIWQSHPFTPLNAPETEDGVTRHSYIFRAKGGETRKIAEVLKAKKEEEEEEEEEGGVVTPVILTGPYGENLVESHGRDENILCVAGGTGITYVLPIILAAVRGESRGGEEKRMDLIWFVRHASDMEWIRPELDTIQASSAEGLDLTIRVFTTRDTSSSSSSSSSSDEKEITKKNSSSRIPQKTSILTVQPASRPPDVRPIVQEFLERTIRGPATVVASGPGRMMSELRDVVARANDGGRVWKGEERFDVKLQCDDRLEY